MRQAATGDRRERGIALLLVIWMMALLSSVAMIAAGNARADLQIARNLLDAAQASSLADGGVWWMMARLAERDAVAPGAILDNADGTPTRLSLDGRTIEVAVQDEGGKIDVNTADATLLANLCRVVGLGAGAEAIAEDIVQYRERRSRDRSKAAPQPAFIVIEELRLVPGLDLDIYARLLPFVTVYTRDGRVNPRTAPREVIMALPGILPLQAEAYLRDRARKELGAETAALPVSLASAAHYLSVSTPQIVTVTATTHGGGQVKSVREAVVELAATPDHPLHLIAWRIGPAVLPEGSDRKAVGRLKSSVKIQSMRSSPFTPMPELSGTAASLPMDDWWKQG
jgi:general secretion pathway protein K